MVEWEDVEMALIELSEEAKASSDNFEEMLMRYTELVDEFLSEMELSKQEHQHAIQIAKRYNYNSEYSSERGQDEEDEPEHAMLGE
jgi:uncharacterized membrane protein